jgi:phytoene synthase
MAFNEKPGLIERTVFKAHSNFFLPMLCLPRERRQALLTVYAFCRHTDDIVDQTNGADVVRRLDEWATGFRKAVRGHLSHPILSATASVATRFSIPVIHFEELIEGVRRDALGIPFETDAELKDYCRLVAGSVGLMAIRIMGAQSRMAQEFAVRLGEALQLTNILRDFCEDRRMGRVYFPNRLLHQHGLDTQSILFTTDEKALVALLESVCDHVEGLYGDALRLYRQCHTRYLLPALCMHRIYYAIFCEIRCEPRRVLSERVRLSAWDRLKLVLHTMLMEGRSS